MPRPVAVLNRPVMRHLPDAPANEDALLRRQLAAVARLPQEYRQRILDVVPLAVAAVSLHQLQINPNRRRQPLLERIEARVGHPIVIFGAPSDVDAHGRIRFAILLGRSGGYLKLATSGSLPGSSPKSRTRHARVPSAKSTSTIKCGGWDRRLSNTPMRKENQTRAVKRPSFASKAWSHSNRRGFPRIVVGDRHEEGLVGH